MYTTDSDADAIAFGKQVMNSLSDRDVQELLSMVSNGDTPDIDILKAGFAMGATKAYAMMMPRALRMGHTLKGVYTKLEGMMMRHDDVSFMADLAALRGDIGAYLSDEAEEVLNATRSKLSTMSGVPEVYIDDKVLISDIPAKVLTSIGRRAAESNMRMFAIYAVSGCQSSKDGKVLTMEELIDLVKRDKISPERNIENADFHKLLPGYGAVQVRKVRDSYRQVLVNIAHYREAYNTDAKLVTEGLMDRIRKGAET